MDAKKMSLHEFFNGEKIFVIPVYQRKYDWQKSHCQQLLDDIEHVIKTGKTHFLGTFVYQKKSAADDLDEHIIIDGQQRITSIVLISKILYELIGDEYKKNLILTRYIKNYTGREKNKYKLRPTEYDRNIFEKIMNHDKLAEIIFDDLEKSSVIYKNLLFFYEKISISKYSAEKIYEAIKKFNIVGILLHDEDPQEIFESLNSTGLHLTKSDLIRNYLLMSLSYDFQEELYKKYWLEIEKLLRSSESIENFMVQYLITKRKSISVMRNDKKIKLSTDNLYEVFKRYFEETYFDGDEKNNSIEECLKDIYRYAKFYSCVIFTDDDNFDNLSALRKKFYELTFLLDAKQTPIILMYLYEKYEEKFFDEETFIKFVDAMISLTFRAKVCGNNGINAQFAGNVILKLDKINSFDEDSFWKIITFGKGKFAFPNDETFKKDLMKEPIFSKLRSDGCKYLLYSLERNSERSAELPKYPDITIEHIMPQKLNESWKNYLQSKKDIASHEVFLHTLGNLTLMAGKYNSRISNSDFKNKKSEYEQSAFFYTSDLKKYYDWTSSQIQIRAKKLANSALKIWILPEKYNSATLDIGSVFSLESDFGIFTGRKPDILSISEKEIEVKTWRDLLSQIIKTLYALDKDSFRLATQKENSPKNLFFTDLENFSGSYITIDSDYYMATKFDTERCLRIIEILVENFDSICGTNFKDEIWFTLKK